MTQAIAKTVRFREKLKVTESRANTFSKLIRPLGSSCLNARAYAPHSQFALFSR
jgi:hypothetical protein